MSKRLAAFVVGHENWGKSHTLFALKHLCGSHRRKRYVAIGGVQFHVRVEVFNGINVKDRARAKGFRTFLLSAL